MQRLEEKGMLITILKNLTSNLESFGLLAGFARVT